MPTVELLSAPTQRQPRERAEFAEWEAGAAELNRMVATSERVDAETIRLLADQIENTRRLDRRFGAATLLGALRLHAQHIESLFAHCTDGTTTRALAAVLTDAHTLAGWQSLDRGEIGHAWDHYRRACDAARAAESPALHAHAFAEQAVVLADIGRTADGAAVSTRAREIGSDGPPLLRAWLAAAQGEASPPMASRTQACAPTPTPNACCPAAPSVTATGRTSRSIPSTSPAGAGTPSHASGAPKRSRS